MNQSALQNTVSREPKAMRVFRRRSACASRPPGRLGPLSAGRRRGAAPAGRTRSTAWAVKDHADPALAELCDDFPLDRAGQSRPGHPLLPPPRRDATPRWRARSTRCCCFSRWAWLRHLPDLRTIRMLFSALSGHAQGLPRRHAAGGDRRRVRRRGHPLRAGHRLRSGVAREARTASPAAARRPGSRRTSSSAGRWPRRWAGSTSARAWP